MARNWTNDQKKAIDARDVSLVVSAAAGSGKTAVLTERILTLLQKGSIRASHLAVVTFTKAAAKELEDRLYGALSKKAADDRGNRNLTQQLFGLARAQISTIHSFAFSLVKEYHKELGLPDGVRILAPTEATEEENRAANGAMREFCRKAKAAGEDSCHQKIFSLLGTGKGTGAVKGAATSILKEASHFPGKLDLVEEMTLRLKEEIEAMETGKISFFQSLYGKEIQNHVTSILEGVVGLLEYLEKELATRTDNASKKYLDFFAARRVEYLEAKNRIAAGDVTRAAEALETTFSPKTKVPQACDDKNVANLCKNLYNKKIKDVVKSLLPVFQESEADALADLKETLPYLELLLDLAKDIEARYQKAKKEKGVVDYNDLEHMAFSLVLEKKEGSWVKTALAEEISQRFDALFVDEYQDTNAVQDMLFRAIAKPGSLFIVGDPKQSIYRFRGAEPSIFQEYKEKLPLYPAEGEEMQKIFLSDNFRCNASVIDLVNTMFVKIMDETAPDSLYSPLDRLKCSKEESDLKEYPFPSEVVIVDQSTTEPDEEDEEEGEAERGEEADENEKKYNSQAAAEEKAEAAWIANRIVEMLGQERGEKKNAEGVFEKLYFVPSDFAVICNTHLQCSRIKAALDKRGIPCTSEKKDGIKENEEFLFLHSLFTTLDNPMRDVPLLAVLSSPVFRFSPDDLYRLRLHSPKKAFYSALLRYGEDGEDAATREKCLEATKTLRDLREKAYNLPLPSFLFYLYGLWGIDLIYGEGEGKVKDVLFAAGNAAAGSGITTPGAFARFLSGSELPAPEGESGVQLCTIHKSKGLEYPVVFVSFMGDSYSTEGEKSSFLMTSPLGGALPVPEQGAKRNTLLRQAVKNRIHRENMEEEKRKLYVATTRARQKLILTGSAKTPQDILDGILAIAKTDLTVEAENYLYSMAKSSFITALLPLRQSPAVKELTQGKTEAVDKDVIFRIATPGDDLIYAPAEAEETKVLATGEEDSLAPAVTFRGDFTSLPGKLSVSAILRHKEREEEKDDFYPKRLMDFENGRLRSSAEAIGTATHKVMQFADFALFPADPDKEFERLVEKGFLSKEEMDIVQKDKVLAFFDSPLYKEMAASKNVEHEKRWAVLLPASVTGYGEEGEVLVQGVVDAWFENPDGSLTIVDFKTDRVKDPDGEDVLRDRHGEQLRLYAVAVEKMTGKPVSRLVVYSFALSRTVEI